MTPQERPVWELIAAPHPDRAPLPPLPGGPGVRELRGVPYGEVPDGRPLELDLWLPELDATDPPAPLVLFVHGGAWRRGRRDDLGMRTRHWAPRPFARLAATGLAVACVDYRLSGEATFPAPLDDLRTALRWLALRGPELGVDAARTVVWGESAGGHLAALLALAGSPNSAAQPSFYAPRGAVLWYAPSDLTTARGGFRPDDAQSPEAGLLGAAPSGAPETARAASPLAQVHAGAPPFLLAHGEADVMVDPAHSTALATALQHAGAQVELRTVPGADHGWHRLPESEVEELFQYSLEFAHRCVA